MSVAVTHALLVGRTRDSSTTAARQHRGDRLRLDGPAAPPAHLDICSVVPLLTTAIQRIITTNHRLTCARPCK